MKLNIDMLESLVFSAVGVAEAASLLNELPRDLQEQIMYLSVCIQRLNEESEDLTPERWAEFVSAIDGVHERIL
jgi:hypothetical protein